MIMHNAFSHTDTDTMSAVGQKPLHRSLIFMIISPIINKFYFLNNTLTLILSTFSKILRIDIGINAYKQRRN
jgi:hypothetical protein